jgi:hypothetical protein
MFRQNRKSVCDIILVCHALISGVLLGKSGILLLYNLVLQFQGLQITI